MARTDFENMCLLDSEKKFIKKFKHKDSVKLQKELDSESDLTEFELIRKCITWVGVEAIYLGKYEKLPNSDKYFVYLKDNCRKFWKNSVLVPIGVAIITTFLIELIQYLLWRQ
jgi:hypothetical protein